MAVLAVLVVSGGLIHAGGTPDQKCAAAKSKAVSKKFASKLRCFQKAAVAGKAIDPTCLMAAENKFNTTIPKVEKKGGCALMGDGATLETIVDNDANDIGALLTTAPGTCCSDGSTCYYTGDPNCVGNDTPGAAGTVCDGSGSCMNPPAHPGHTCSGPFGFANCVAGPSNTILNCAGAKVDPNTLAFDPSGVCPPDGGRSIH